MNTARVLRRGFTRKEGKMQFLMIALCIAGFGDNLPITGEGPGWSPVDAEIQFEVLNDYHITWADKICGMEYVPIFPFSPDPLVLFSTQDSAKTLNPATGAPGNFSECRPDGSGLGFGIAVDNIDSTIVLNSETNTNLWYYLGGEDWLTAPNPAGTNGTGLTCEGNGYYWQGNGTGLVRFKINGPSTNFSNMAPSGISGVTVVPSDDPSKTRILVTTYDTDTFVLWEFDGGSMTQIATGVTPPSLNANRRRGLCWDSSRNSLFLAYQKSDDTYRICELNFEVLSMPQDTWAGIKSAF